MSIVLHIYLPASYNNL